ncbi:MAG TPA: prepilin-type N-terminal cleavage/methylation domain-containing protein [Rickettsiales bacterium]|nr:prepilin-type N-terminal cleavage/methylation domain-containing protein [Rickettsiales bacterium]
MKKNGKGFSLIELSIVLIIIGLLVAGITGGASLIKSAELRATISEIRNYQIAVNAFFVEKGYLPGTSSGSSDQMDLLYSGTAWNELYSANITTFDAIATTTAFTASSDVNSPKGKMKGSVYLFGYIDTYLNDINSNSLLLVGNGTVTEASTSGTGELTAIGTNTSLPILKPSTAKQIDNKMDDSKPSSGKVLALGSSGTAACQSTATTPAYNDTLTDNLCGLAFKLNI